MSIKDLVLFQKTYDYLLWIFPLINRFPKQQRFILGQEMEKELLLLLKIIHYFQRASSNTKGVWIERMSIHVDILGIHIRLAKDLHFLSVQHYGIGCDKLNELGRILTGLKKATRTSHTIKQKHNAVNV